MRVLFTCGAELGHLHPHLPLARALAEAGHAVGFAVPESFGWRVEQAGFIAMPAPPDRAEVAREIERRFPHWATVTAAQRFRFSLVDVGSRIVAPLLLPALIRAIEVWDADLLVHGPAVLAGPLAAAVAGIPWVNQSWGTLLPLDDLQDAADAVSNLWATHGLAPLRYGGMFEYLYLDASPPSLQGPEIANIMVTHPLRPAAVDAVGDENLPAWVAALPPRPTVCVTLGTFYNRLTRVFSAVLDGVRREPVNVIALVGHDQDPTVLGPQPDNVWVERYIPLSLLLPHCDLLVTHGGSGSVLAALAQGIPLLLVPQGADQFQNAQRCVACGAGRAMPPGGDLEPALLAAEVAALLHEEGFRRAAEAVQKEIQVMPSPQERVGLLEELGTQRLPLPSRPSG